MGLFGGFKAKFTGSSSSKNKPQEIVCLKYHIHSEFDAPDSEKSLQANSIKKNEVVRPHSKKKDRKALTKSAVFPETQTLQSSSPAPTPQKSLSLTNLNSDTSPAIHKQQNGHAGSNDPITVSTTFTVPSNGTSVAVSDTKYKKTTEEHNGLVTEKVAVVTNNHLYSTDHSVRNEQHAQSILKKVTTYDEDGTLTNGAEYTSDTHLKPKSFYETPVKENGGFNDRSTLTNGTEYMSDTYLKPKSVPETSAKENGGFNDQSTLIFMTQHSSRSSSFDKTMEIDHINFTKSLPLDSNKLQQKYNEPATDENFNINFVPNHVTDDEVDYFKINIMKHDLSRTYSRSEDEQSHDEEEEPRFTRMGYSSQAASIFFGEGEEAEIARPRRIQLMEDDDERRSSGADC
ncbi:uncharacterized protein LOC108906884 [Anoplophora glabripennis]|uniref:uncharacterized protein LOC108906884 n=1 Tax=Anoplophora glabripennis TaxID=217634 RepID=UPI000874DA8C|nr:uncharacterized protein LOC108906884 [Anoplophora glabripennis]